MFNRFRIPTKQSGMMLLEGLIAILIFSLGILALVGLQTIAVRQVSDAGYRSEAGLLVNQLIGTMWAGDRAVANLKEKYKSPDGEKYLDWVNNSVSSVLPGVADNKPEVLVADDGTVTVSVYWLAPGEPEGTARHQYTVSAKIRPDKDS